MLEFHFHPENIANGYHVVSLIENNGVKDKKDQRFDLPIVRSSETTETNGTAGTAGTAGTVGTFGTSETTNLTTIMVRGLPIHMPSATVGANSAWDGWSEVGMLIIHQFYTLGGVKEVAGRRCAEVSYKLQAVQKSPDGGTAQDQNVTTGDGRFLFDLNSGVIVVHTWQMNSEKMRADYAAVLNI